ncbi:MAG: hypothetical protein JWN98_2478 [Abditibacteriota bacterium]|nr:hypothetical protein [Abditibacteriota bacterium]
MQEFAPGVVRLPNLFVNAYFIEIPHDGWVLVDSGLPKAANVIRAKAEERFGKGARPKAIILTHGHFDHSGSARQLAESWNVPIYAHALEVPYLSGQSDYPPHDPTIGGAIAQMSRFFPRKSVDLGTHLHALPAGKETSLDELPGWKIMHTPGHSPGHISLFREEDRTLVAGDAFATEDMDSWLGMMTMAPKIARSGAPFNCDWGATRQSVRHLAALKPYAVGAGHGQPLNHEYEALAHELADFALHFPMPGHGRYAHGAAQVDENGVLEVPPAPLDLLPKIVVGALVSVFVMRTLQGRHHAKATHTKRRWLRQS